MEWALLRRLSDEDRRRVVAATRRRRFGRREVVFHDGDPGDVMHFVARGHVAIRVTTPLGDVATLRIVGPGEVFGELALVATAPRRGSAVTIDPVETLALHRDSLDELRASTPAFDGLLVEMLAHEVRRLSVRLVDALYTPADRRTWRCLLELTDAFARDGHGADAAAEAVVVPLTQDDIAQIAGTTRPTVNRLLRGAEAAGVVRLARGRVEVLDRGALEHRAR